MVVFSKNPAARAAAGARPATSRIANWRIVDLGVRNGNGSGINDLQRAAKRGLALLKAILGGR